MKIQPDKRYVSAVVYGLIIVTAGAFLVLLLFGARDFFVNKQYEDILTILNPFIIGFAFAYLLNPLLALYEKKVLYKVHWRKNDADADFKLKRMLSLTATFVTALVVISMILLMIVPQIGASVNQLTEKVIDLFSPPAAVAATEPTMQGPAELNEFLISGSELEVLREELGEAESLSSYEALMNTQIGMYISDTAATIQGYISRFGFKVDLEQTINELFMSMATHVTVFFSEYLETIFNTTANFIVATAKQVLNIIIAIIIAFYILSDKEHLILQIKRLLFALLPTEFAYRVIGVTRKTHTIFTGFITGKLLDSLIVGLICFICMTLFGIQYPMLISVIICITNVIPFFGPFIGAIPSILFLAINDMGQGIWFLFFVLILQQVDGNIIGPKIIGSSIGLSPFWVIFAILVMNGLLGPLGMFIGVPVFAVLYTLIKEFSEGRLEKKALPAEALAAPVDSDATPSGGSKEKFMQLIEKLLAVIAFLKKYVLIIMAKARKCEKAFRIALMNHIEKARRNYGDTLDDENEEEDDDDNEKR